MTTTVDLYIVKIFWEKNLTGPYRSFSTYNYSDANGTSTRLHLGYRSVPVQGRAWLRLTPSADPFLVGVLPILPFHLFCLALIRMLSASRNVLHLSVNYLPILTTSLWYNVRP
jgi:hypothetical protein